MIKIDNILKPLVKNGNEISLELDLYFQKSDNVTDSSFKVIIFPAYGQNLTKIKETAEQAYNSEFYNNKTQSYKLKLSFADDLNIVAGEHYKILIQHICKVNNVTYESNYGIAKCINNIITTLSLIDGFKAIFNFTPNSNEFLKSMVFKLKKDGVIIEESEEIISNYLGLNPNNILIQEYQFQNYSLTNGKYDVEVAYTTINNYQETIKMDSSVYIEQEIISLTSEMKKELKLDYTFELDDAVIMIGELQVGDELYRQETSSGNPITLLYTVTTDNSAYFKDINICYKINDHNYILKRFDREDGDNKYYKYYKILIDDDLYFDDMFLYDNSRQLRIRFNPKVSSYKINIQEQKIDTIGNRYPIFFRNGNIAYREFTIGGLISYMTDDNKYFTKAHSQIISNAEMIRNRTASEEEDIINIFSINDKFYYEQVFRKEVFDWLTNGELKVFKSPAEGNIIVRLSGLSLSPNEGLGRMVCEFTCTATEMAEYNLKNLQKYNLLSNLS